MARRKRDEMAERERLYQTGMTDKQLSEATGATVSAICRWRERAGHRKIKPPRTPLPSLNQPRGVSYKTALPPERWGEMEKFLGYIAKATPETVSETMMAYRRWGDGRTDQTGARGQRPAAGGAN